MNKINERIASYEIIVKQKNKVKKQNRIKIKYSDDIYKIIPNLVDLNTIEFLEKVYLIGMNNQNEMLLFSTLSIGGTSQSIIDLKVLFTQLIMSNCSCYIILHNHPSGTLKPSKNDDLMFEKLKKASKIMDIHIIDSIIIAKIDEEIQYYSYADNGKL